MRPRVIGLVVGLAMAAGGAGCGAEPVAQVREAAPPPAPASVLGETRSAVLHVPTGMQLNSVSSGRPAWLRPGARRREGRREGHALRHRDGGRSWSELKLPLTRLTDPFLVALAPATPIIHADEGWLVSNDFGRTFRLDPPDATNEFSPPELGQPAPGCALRVQRLHAGSLLRADRTHRGG